MPTIEISEDTYAALGRLVIPFTDRTPEDVIIRLIQASQQVPASAIPEAPSRGSHGGLVSSGTTIPNGTRLRGKHRGRYITAEVREDRIWVDGRPYDSPSKAAIAAAQALGATGFAYNGWRWWDREMPDAPGRWEPLDSLRSEADRRSRG